MVDFLSALEEAASLTHTENGALTYDSSSSPLVDLFSSIGALRNAPPLRLQALIEKAWSANPDLTMRILFYGRDVRGGLGERSVFNTALQHLAKLHPASVVKNIPLIPEYGRFADLLPLLSIPETKNAADCFLHETFKEDLAKLANGNGNVSLVGKWLPSINASSAESARLGRMLASSWGLSEKAYRKSLSKLRSAIGILETKLTNKDYSFDYSKQPSRALFKYRKAFMRNDEARYEAYIDRVLAGKEKMNTATLQPYDIVHQAFPYVTTHERKALDAAWSALPDYTQDREDAIVVMDGSGSMYGRPIEVAMSLAIYFAEHNKGRFANHFITFSSRPRLVDIQGNDIVDKVRYCAHFNEVANTDLEAVFNLILDTAVKGGYTQEDIPGKLYIITDMEFDYCVTGGNSATLYKTMADKYAQHGYKLPTVVFWNVDSRNDNFPVKANDVGVSLVSGSSPSVFQMVIEGSDTPYSSMMRVLDSPRYRGICS